MAFFGANSTQKNAQGRIGELGNWSYAKMPEWYDKSNQFMDKGTYWTNQSADYWDNLLRNGSASQDPAQNRATGQQIMPGVDQAIQSRANRLDQSMNSFQNLPSAQQTGDTMSGWTDQYGGAISQNATQNTQDNQSNWGRGNTRNETANRDITGNIGGTYSKIGDWLNEAYGGMRGTNANAMGGMQGQSTNAYGGMQGQNDAAYTDVSKNLEALKPGGVMQQAQVARSYAPLMVNAAGRARAAGASPLQAEESMQMAERERARGMDEAAGGSAAQYVNALNQARTGQLDRSLGLGQNALNTGLDLGLRQLGTELDLQRGQNEGAINMEREGSGLMRGETLRNAGLGQQLDDAALERQLGINTDTMNRNTNYIGQRQDNAALLRAMQQQDWGTVDSMLARQNENDLTGLGLQNQQYQQGFNQNAYNQGLQGSAAGQLGGLGKQGVSNAFGAANLGRGYANDALQQYLQSYRLEAPNAGWGTKLLAGLGSSLIPGMNTVRR